jgi:hypothetical protein
MRQGSSMKEQQGEQQQTAGNPRSENEGRTTHDEKEAAMKQ